MPGASRKSGRGRAHHLVFNTPPVVGLTPQAARGEEGCRRVLRSEDWAGAVTSFDLLRHVEDRAGDVEGALAHVWEASASELQ